MRLRGWSAGVVVALALAGCATTKEEFRDAPMAFHDDSPAEIYNMPDGFSNVAAKCDRHGNRIYVTMNNNGRALAVVADPTCQNLGDR